MDGFELTDLDALYAKISSVDGVTVTELRLLVGEFSNRKLSTSNLRAYREGKKPWKKLRDEVAPVEKFLSARFSDDMRIRFPLDDRPPDAWLIKSNGRDKLGIEVTGALARAGIAVGKSLADGKPVPGFIGLQDDATTAEFAKAKKRGRVTHSRAGVDQATDRGVLTCMAKKDDPKFADHILLVVAPLKSSPNRSPADLRSSLGKAAEDLPFSEVFLIDPAPLQPIIVQLK